MPGVQTDRFVLLGRPGEGKTVLAAYLLRGWPPGFVWVYNPTRDRLFGRYKECGIDRPPPEKNCLVCLDEADKIAGHSYRADWVEALINTGRNFNVSWICASKRPQKLSRDVTSYCTVAYIFNLTGSRDIDYLVEEWGDRCQAIRLLDKHEFLRVYPQDPYKALTVHRLPPEVVSAL